MTPTGKGPFGQTGVEPSGTIRTSFYREFVKRQTDVGQPMLTLYPVGSAVSIDKEVPATVVAVSLRGDGNAVSYQVEWWDGRKIESREFDESRVSPGKHGVQPIRMGFHPKPAPLKPETITRGF